MTNAQHEYATLEHLLLALIDDADAAAVMGACNVNLDTLRKTVTDYVDNELSNLVTGYDEDSKPTAGFQRVIQRAVIHVAGVHIGAGLVQLTVTNLLGSPKAAASFEYGLPNTSPEALTTRIADEIERLKAVSGVEDLLGVGVGVPGPVDAGQRSILASINTGWRNLPLAGMRTMAARPLPCKLNRRTWQRTR